MKLLVHQVGVPLDYTETDLRSSLARKLAVDLDAIGAVEIQRRSLDARPERAAPAYSLSVMASVAGPPSPRWLGQRDIEPAPAPATPVPPRPPRCRPPGAPRPVVVGAGPAGLMAAWRLAQAGLKPLLVDRGSAVERRAGQVEAFWRSGELNAESNVLYGEGGAGLFSDGKLTSRSKDRPRQRLFFETLVAAGAPADILIDAEPHLGSDRLLGLVPRLRAMIVEAGGEVCFDTRLDSLLVEGGRLRAVRLAGGDLRTDACVLATGHSARELLVELAGNGVQLEPKPFAIGLRLEVPQSQIDASQFGQWAGRPGLGAASFRLTRREEAGVRACYSFCMCPGGLVIACASSPGALTTNGMSLFRRAKPFGNAAFLVPVNPDDFLGAQVVRGSPPELAGHHFQHALEENAFLAGGADYSLPASSLTDFLAGKVPVAIPVARSCERARPADLAALLPEFAVATLRQAIPPMLRQMRRVDPAAALLYGLETRSSSPVRIGRDESCQNPTCRGLFPCGEGAGYAGGIVSSAIDGLRIAEAILENG